jgi:hypothetical protein
MGRIAGRNLFTLFRRVVLSVVNRHCGDDAIRVDLGGKVRDSGRSSRIAAIDRTSVPRSRATDGACGYAESGQSVPRAGGAGGKLG